VRPDLAPFAEIGTLIPFAEEQLLGEQGALAPGLFLVLRGQVLLRRTSSENGSQAVCLLGPGDAFGEGSLLEDRRFLFTVRAVTPGSAVLLTAAQLHHLARASPEQARAVLQLLSRRLEISHTQVELLGAGSPRTRVLGWLHAWARRQGHREGNETWLPLGLTHAELGEVVGLARETVTRTLALLEKDGVIRRSNRQGMWLTTAARTVRCVALGAISALPNAVAEAAPLLPLLG